MFVQQGKFFGQNTLIEGVFVTQLRADTEVSV
jgi:hypothetical protein